MRFLLILLSVLLVPQIAMAGGFESLGMTGTERGIYTVLILSSHTVL